MQRAPTGRGETRIEQNEHTHSNGGPCRACALEKARKLGLDRILVALDGSSLSETSVPYAAMMARWLDAELTLFHVVHAGQPFHHYRQGQVRYPDALHDRAAMLASAYLGEISARVTASGVRCRWGTATGHAAQLIVSRAAEGGYGMVVMTVRTLSPLRRALDPGVLEEVWRTTPVPVLFVRERLATTAVLAPTPPPEFIMPLSGNPASPEARPVASALAGASGATVTLLSALVTRRSQDNGMRVGSDPGGGSAARMQESASQLREDRIGVQTVTRAGIPAHAILSRQRESPGSWVVIASTMSHGFSRTIFGSTTDGVLRGARGPVVVVPMAQVAARRALRVRAALRAATEQT